MTAVMASHARAQARVGPILKSIGALIQVDRHYPNLTVVCVSGLLSADAARGSYFGSILTAVLKTGLPWTPAWAGQILFYLVWLQVALLAGYAQGQAMCYA